MEVCNGSGRLVHKLHIVRSSEETAVCWGSEVACSVDGSVCLFCCFVINCLLIVVSISAAAAAVAVVVVTLC